MSSVLKKKDWSKVKRRALSATELVSQLAMVNAWKLHGDVADLAIEKSYTFANYHETISFVNAVAFIANVQDHHPELGVFFNRCVVRFNTHDVGGVSMSDFECAALVDDLLGLV